MRCRVPRSHNAFATTRALRTRSTTSATRPGPNTPPASTPVTHPGPSPSCATSPSEPSASPATPTSQPASATTPGTRTAHSPRWASCDQPDRSPERRRPGSRPRRRDLRRATGELRPGRRGRDRGVHALPRRSGALSGGTRPGLSHQPHVILSTGVDYYPETGGQLRTGI